MLQLSLADIQAAAKRLDGHINDTPLLTSSFLDNCLGHQFYFKAESLQKIGAFKSRGAYNTLAWLKEQGQLPEQVVAYSSGNHAQAVAWAAKEFGIHATILMPENVSKIKAQATQSYGAQVLFCKTRGEAEQRAEELAAAGVYLIPPYDHDQVICGQGTAAFDALIQQPDITAVFAPCGGGGLLSGTLIAAKGLKDNIKVYGAEPVNANDAAISLKQGKIHRLEDSPNTIADGVKTLSVAERTFHYIRQLDGIIEVEEQQIIYWTQWLTHLLKVTVEPTSALSMAAACNWLKEQTTPQKVLLILSGGNLDVKTRQSIWQYDCLDRQPSL